MAPISRAALAALQNLHMVPGVRMSNADLTTVLNALRDSLLAILDDANVNERYLQIDVNGRVDISKITAAAAANKFLMDNGSWADVLAKVLAGYVVSSGGVDATDSILSAIQKLYGNNPVPTRITASPTALVKNSTNITDYGVGRLMYDLPVAVVTGERYLVRGFSANGWRIRQNAGQQIFHPLGSTTVGAGGYIESSNRYDCVELVCVAANVLVVANSQGNFVTA